MTLVRDRYDDELGGGRVELLPPVIEPDPWVWS